MAKRKKNIQDPIEQALQNYTCPYCGKKMKSASGRTLHIQAPCKKVAPNVKAASKLKVGERVSYRRNSHKIAQIRDGLVALGGGTVVNATRLNEATPEPKKATKVKSPRTVLEWVDSYMKLRGGTKDLAGYLKHLFKISSYTKYKRWTYEDLIKALESRSIT